MTLHALYQPVLIAWFAVAAVILVVLQFMRAAYGRYVGQSRAPLIPAALGWVIMESVSALLLAGFFVSSGRTTRPVELALFALWELHYVHRAWIYPLRGHLRGRRMPISIVGMGVLFNVVNAALNGYGVFHLAPERSAAWLLDPRFVVGALVFFAGMIINLHSDGVLIGLRRAGGAAYQIPPDRGLFRWVSCPNYLGEILEWCGWALASWSLAGLSFAAWTFANLAPRALSHHRWYRQTFADYPAGRRAVIPFVL